MLFNIALKKTIREIQKDLIEQKIQVLGFADDLNILRSSFNYTKSILHIRTVSWLSRNKNEGNNIIFEKINKSRS